MSGAIRDLRLLTLSSRGFDGRGHTGRLVVIAECGGEVSRSSGTSTPRASRSGECPDRRLRRQRLPLDRGRQHVGVQLSLRRRDDPLVEARIRAARSTSNPIENPYVSGGSTSHIASRRYVIRSGAGRAWHSRAGLVRAFDRVGWGWGGRWSSVKDYQDFSASGR